MLLRNWTFLRKLAVLLSLACSAAHGKSELETAGLAVYTETARDIYIAGLLLPADSSLENVYLAPGPKAMEYRIATRRISNRGFSGTLLLQAEFGSGKRAPAEVIDVLGELKKQIKGSLLRGDRFVVFLSEDENTTFYLNDTRLLSVDDGAVFDFFFAGWLGESSSALFRGKLLSGNLNADTLARFEALAPSDERLATISDWMAPPPPPPPPPPPEPEPEPEASQVALVPAEQTVPGPAPATTVAAAMPAPAADIPVKEAPAATEDPAPLDDRAYQQQLSAYTSNIMRQVFGKVKYPKRAIKRERQGKVELLIYVRSEEAHV